MGKRVAGGSTKTAASEVHKQFTPPLTRTKIRKRKHNGNPAATVVRRLRLSGAAAANGGIKHNYSWHENDDEDSSSNDCPAAPAVTNTATTAVPRSQSSKHGNNSSILLNSSLDCESTAESPKPVYSLRPSVVNGTILYDLTQKPWRLGRPIGKGNFGEIFLASDNITIPVTNENAKFVVKIEPHSNGPLFVEIHCLMNTRKKPDTSEEECNAAAAAPQIPPSGIPDYIASGSHYFGDARYRFLVLPRFDRDLHSLIRNCRVQQKSVLTLAIQIVNVLENLHDKGYCHNDVKAQNLMISKCKYFKRKLTTTTTTTTTSAHGGGKSKALLCHKTKYDDERYEEKQPTTDSGNSSEQEANDDDADFVVKRYGAPRTDEEGEEDEDDEDEDDDEDFDDGATSNNSNSVDAYQTPLNRNRKARPRKTLIEYSGSNPVRSCRGQKRNSIYEEMVKSHYLRPTKRISYSEFFNEDGASIKGRNGNDSSADESEEFVPHSARRNTATATSGKKALTTAAGSTKRSARRCLTTRYQERSITTTTVVPELVAVEEERIFLIDFGLASKFMDNDVHRPFVMDQRRAHDGTLEFTSRDAHMGAHSRRSDLECLGYNLLYWSQGYLPWKEAAQQHQQEKVHRAKEYLMTDVRELLKQIYGKQIPKYLGEFLYQVGQLAHHERPDYARYRRIFEREFQQDGHALGELRLDSHEIARTCVRHHKDETESNKQDIFDVSTKLHNNSAWSILSNLSVSTPFHERMLSNRVSPKNLRSKSDNKSLKKKKFSWAEVLSQDPDQIARERAEKEFDREEVLSDVQQLAVRRYQGKPTYAILEVEQRLKLSGRLIESQAPSHEADVGDAEMGEAEEDNDEPDEDEEAESDNDAHEGEGEDENAHMEVSDNSDAGTDEADEDDDDDDEEQTDKEEKQECYNNNNNHDEDDDIDTDDATEASSEQQHSSSNNSNGQTSRRTRNVVDSALYAARCATARATATKKLALKVTAAAATTCTEAAPVISRGRGRPKGSGKQTIVEYTTRTRSSASSTTSGTVTINSNKKRGSATRNGRSKKSVTNGLTRGAGEQHAAASAAGEIEHHQYHHKALHQHHHQNHHTHQHALRYFEHSVQRSEIGRQQDGGGSGGSHVGVLERRTRRCLIKTEAEAVLGGEESNSNFSPDVRSLFNVWKKFNQQHETMYFRGNNNNGGGGAAAAARHYKK